ncbi:MAG: ribonuclease P [Parcubacteria group bacterium Gr01-1014_33]|nr:MAG: ribonuclease P [Parcubacteria group bacterium Gr01-1014_33]
MKRIYRLRSKKDFQLLFKAGKRIETPAFRIIVRKNKLLYSRFAFIAAKSAEKRAVKRNMVRRRSREWIRKFFPLTDVSLDVAFIFKKSAWALPRNDFYKELTNAKEKIIN